MADALDNLSLPERLGLNSDQFRKFWKQARAKLHVCKVGIVQSFNASAQTVVVKVAIQEKVNKNVGGSLVQQDMELRIAIGRSDHLLSGRTSRIDDADC